MRMRSTGLGKTELEAEVDEIEPCDGILVLHIQTTSPVIWHVRTVIQRKDIFSMLKAGMKFGVIKHALGMIFRCSGRSEPAEF
ncbi:hypothetical protein ACFL0H_10255 [Thermodesulfobacteriota bacterium]